MVICTHPDSHFEYARLCLAHGKTCWSRNLYNHPRRSENAVCSGERKGLTVSPFQNRRFDSCYLTMKQAIESGKLGKLSRSKAILTIFARRRKPVPAVISTARFMALACIRSINYRPAGRPQQVGYHLQRQRNPLNPDDAFTVHLYYPKTTAIVKTSHLVKIRSPRFTVHGTRGSFIRYGIDQQETSLKAGIMPGTRGLVKIVNARCWSISMTQDVLSGRNCGVTRRLRTRL